MSLETVFHRCSLPLRDLTVIESNKGTGSCGAQHFTGVSLSFPVKPLSGTDHNPPSLWKHGSGNSADFTEFSKIGRKNVFAESLQTWGHFLSES